MRHGTTPESEMAFDMDASATLVCECGFTGTSDQMLDHLVDLTIDWECEDCGRVMGTSELLYPGEQVCDNCGFHRPIPKGAL